MIPEGPEVIRVGAGTTLEASRALPPGATAGVVFCHPHPLYGGDMENPVILAAARACARHGLATLRFNFRGVAGSGGVWDEGRGEQDDVRAALDHLRGLLGRRGRVALAGYSFGAAMATVVAAGGEPLAGLALIAPPLASPGWQRPQTLVIDGPVLVVAGSEDTHCPRPALAALAPAMPAATITVIDGADHFFDSGLRQLAIALGEWAAKLTAEPAA
jgi:alpha/beta superfamily hydrolase